MTSPVKWMIEKDIFREDVPDRLAEFAVAKGMETLRVQRIPFSDNINVVGKNNKPSQVLLSSNMPWKDECVVVYGSLNICKQLMNPKRWVPTAWFDLERFRCVSYYAHWGKYLLNDALMMMPWGELRRQSHAVYDKFKKSRQTRDLVSIFIKPDSNDKIFSGKIVHWDDFEKWAKQEEDCYEVPPEALVLVSEALPPLDAEWRFVICDRKVVTGTIYKIAGETSPLPLSEDRPAPIALAEEMAAHPWQPASVYVLDICATQMDPAGGSYKVLECGPFNGAGLYKCDLDKVVDAVSAQALKEWKAEAPQA